MWRGRGGTGLLAGTALLASLFGTAVGAAPPVAADEVKPSAMVLVLDASGSMNEPDGHGSTKIAAAKSALTTIVGQLPADLQVGLRVYGHRVASKPDHAKACRDTELVAPVAALDKAGLTAAIGRFKAKGETPIGLSLQQAGNDLPKGAAGSIVLVSDGQDSCAPPAPCDVAKQLKASGINVTVDTVGLKVDAKAKSELTCIATSTGGTYTDVTDTSQLAGKLGAVTQQAARARRTTSITGEKVSGTPDRTGAPKLVPGTTYSDSIVHNETLFYAVDLAEGQQATVTVKSDGNHLPKETERGWGLTLALVSAEDDSSLYTQYHNDLKDKISTLVVKGPVIEAADSDDNQAGTYYVRLNLEDQFGPGELPITVTVATTGAGALGGASASGPSAGATETGASADASSAPAASPAPEAAAAPSGRGGFTWLQVAEFTGGGFVGGLLTGLLLMLVLRSRRKRRRTPLAGPPAPLPPPPAAGPYNPPTYPGR